MSNMKRLAEQMVPRFRDATFDGQTYDARQDQRRLGKQAQRVWNFMSATGKFNLQARPNWWTLRDISECTGFPESSISARLRDFRKPRFGSHTVERRRRKDGHGTWEYRLIVNTGEDE